ncbi:MAG: matrixin family metalloprotease [Candidatus Moraniibacteriota bacterium]
MRFLVPISILLLAGGFAVFFLSSQVPCKRVIEYALGDVDPRFGIAQGVLKGVVQDAEMPWEQAAGRELFRFRPEAPLKVNFLFDERQQATLEYAALEAKHSQTAQKQEAIGAAYDTLKQSFETKRVAFEQKAATYEADLAAYEKAVQAANNRGGASSEEYAQLSRDRETLQARAKSLNAEQKELNVLVDGINAKAKEEGRVVADLNHDIRAYQDRYGAGEEFDQGEYVGNAINIYEFRNTDELGLVLAHEFGHALGLDHVENPASVMYYLMKDQSQHPVRLTNEDQAALTAFCGTDQFFSFENLRELFRYYSSRAAFFGQAPT